MGLLRRIKRELWGGPETTVTQRALRLGAVAFLVAAIATFGVAVSLAVNRGPAPQKLARGVVFSAPPAGTSTPAASPANSETPAPAAAETAPATVPPTPQPTWAVSTPSPTPDPSSAPIAKLQIPAIKVDAPISVKSVDANGVMQDPNSWNDVAWYNFTGRPGFGSGNNAVFAGHVDYIRHGPAVFWDLNKLKPGDAVNVTLQDGTQYSYRVTQMAVYGGDDAPVDAIVGQTPTESVTLITCNGVFSAGHYNNRLVVRAERPQQQPVPLDQLQQAE
jgi:LPXTG-site transpeptidase (sortase) family protein